ncbi:MAG: hypothetical protein ABIJ37_02495 [Pseudomonadota bacterium]
MNTFFVEHAYQVEHFLKNTDCADADWLALGPSAMHYLAGKNLPYTIPEDYVGLNEIEGACKVQFEQLHNVCGKIDDRLQEIDPFLKKWNIRPFLFHLWQLGMVFDAVLSRALWIRKILTKFDVCKDKIYTHMTPLQPWTLFGLGFGKHETLWGRLLLLSEWADSVIPVLDPNKNLHTETRHKKVDSIKNVLRKVVNSNILLRSVVISYQQKMLQNILNLIGTNKKQHIMVMNNPYEWPDILRILISSNISILFLNESILGNIYTEDNVSEIDGNELCLYFFANMVHEGIDFFDILGDRIRWIIEKGPSVARAIIEKMEKICFNKMPIAVLSMSTPDYLNYIIKQFFVAKSIPVLSWQYGAVWYEKDITQRHDLFDKTGTNILLTFGNGVKNAYKLSGMPENIVIESIGSAILDNLSMETRG